MFEPGGSARPVARIGYVTAALLVGAILVGGAVGAAVALVLYLPGVLAADGPPGLIGFGLLMGAASGVGIGVVGGAGAVAGMVAVRVASRRDGTTSTDRLARCTTWCETLPTTSDASRRRPREPRTISVASISSATRTIVSAAASVALATCGSAARPAR